MKKFVFFPNTVVRPFLVSLPLVMLMTAAIRLNGTVDTPLGLLPLIIFCAAAIIFTFVFFFRPTILSRDEVKTIGPFSSRDRAVINEGKTLILTERTRNLVSIDLFGNDGVNADLDWLKSEAAVTDIYLFKSKVSGGLGVIRSVLLFFDLPEADIKKLLESSNIEIECPDYCIKSSIIDEKREVRIRFTNTM